MIPHALPLARTLLAASPGATLDSACGTKQPGTACRVIWDVLHSQPAAQLTQTFLAGPVSVLLRILFVVLVALAIRLVAHRTINKITARAAAAGSAKVDAAQLLLGERRRQRATALGSVLRNAASVLILRHSGDHHSRGCRPQPGPGAGQCRGAGHRHRLRRAEPGPRLPGRDLHAARGPVRGRRRDRRWCGYRHGRGGQPADHPAARRERGGLAYPQRDHRPDRQQVAGLGPGGDRLPGGLRPGPAPDTEDHEGHRGADVAGAALV